MESKSAQLRHFFKRSIIFLRTLYSFVRLLPAYGVSGNRSGQARWSFFVISPGRALVLFSTEYLVHSTCQFYKFSRAYRSRVPHRARS